MDSVPDERRHAPLSGNTTADVAIVGGGIVGVLAAWHLRRRGMRVIILEKNRIATGDTGATTGFLTKVPDASLKALVDAHGEAALAKAFALASAAQKEVFGIIKEQGIPCAFVECDAYYCAYDVPDATLDAEQSHMLKACPSAVAVTGADVPGAPFAAAVRVPGEARYDARAFLFGLLDRMKGDGFAVHEETEVTDVDFSGADVVVRTSGGAVTAKKVVLATGYPIDAFAELRPLLHAYVTFVIGARHRTLTLPDHVYWDTLDPYFYYRKGGNDLLIIGGRDVPFADAPKASDAHERLEAFLRQRFPGEYELTHRWSGSIFHTADGLPYVFADKRERGRAIIAMGLGGNGMVFGALSAKAIADLAVGEETGRTALLGLGRTKTELPPRPERKALAKKWMMFAPVADFEAKPTICREVEGLRVIVTRAGGAYVALDNRCTHQGGSLCDGSFEDGSVRCPLHGAVFDLSSGAPTAPPATRPLPRYATRVVDGAVEIELPCDAAATKTDADDGLSDVEKKEKTWGSLLRFTVVAVAFWALQYAAQRFWLSPGDAPGAFIRAAAFSGATLIGLALLSSAVFKWFPPLSVHWRLRRRLGVAGVIAIVMHASAVMRFYFNYDPKLAFATLDPFMNPVVFGAIAYPLFLVMALTSTDWAYDKLGAKRWKSIHRVAYVAYWAAVLHFMTVNPSVLASAPGALLLAVTAAALFGQLFWYLRIAGKRRFRTWGGLYGAIVIVLYVVAAAMVLVRLTR